MVVWWKLKMLLMSSQQLREAGLVSDHQLNCQLRLWIGKP